jgi:hypothetical protein
MQTPGRRELNPSTQQKLNKAQIVITSSTLFRSRKCIHTKTYHATSALLVSIPVNHEEYLLSDTFANSTIINDAHTS